MRVGFYPQLVSELRREFLIWKSYRINAISSLIMWSIVFPILLVTLMNVAANAGINYSVNLQMASLIGFLIWRLCTGALVAIPGMIEQEASTGTLENVIVTSSLPLPLLLLFRVLARSIQLCLEVIVLGFVLAFVFRLPFAISPTAVLVAFVTLVGVWGVGFALAGLAIIYKNIGGITNLVAYLAFTISGAFVPLNSLAVVFAILKYTFPMTWGIDILRQVIINGCGLSCLIHKGSLIGLLLQSLGLLIIGFVVFNASLNKAAVRGELGVY